VKPVSSQYSGVIFTTERSMGRQCPPNIEEVQKILRPCVKKNAKTPGNKLNFAPLR